MSCLAVWLLGNVLIFFSSKSSICPCVITARSDGVSTLMVDRQGIRRVVRSFFSSPWRVAIPTGYVRCLFDVPEGYLVANGTLK